MRRDFLPPIRSQKQILLKTDEVFSFNLPQRGVCTVTYALALVKNNRPAEGAGNITRVIRAAVVNHDALVHNSLRDNLGYPSQNKRQGFCTILCPHHQIKFSPQWQNAPLNFIRSISAHLVVLKYVLKRYANKVFPRQQNLVRILKPLRTKNLSILP